MIQGNISNQFAYKGVVNIYLQHKGETFNFRLFNSGTQQLNTTIAKALSGIDVTNDIPRYINWYKEDKVTSLLSNRVTITGIDYGSHLLDNSYPQTASALKLNVIIDSADKSTQSIPDSDSTLLAVTDLSNNILATIGDNGAEKTLTNLYNNLSDGTEIIIEWLMIFDNKEN